MCEGASQGRDSLVKKIGGDKAREKNVGERETSRFKDG